MKNSVRIVQGNFKSIETKGSVKKTQVYFLLVKQKITLCFSTDKYKDHVFLRRIASINTLLSEQKTANYLIRGCENTLCSIIVECMDDLKSDC